MIRELVSPGLVFSFLLATAYGAGFHLLFGGRLAKLVLYLLASWVGGILGLSILDVGPVHTFSASLGAWLALLLSHWLGKERAPDGAKGSGQL
jgi:uncharacterized membrane protein YjjP (DUF1212 family)